MTTVFERVRLTIGLAHAAPGARLVVETVEGNTIVVGAEADADLSLCTMRRSVIGSARLGRADEAWAGTRFVIDGSLECVAGDIHRVCGQPERWFATLLHPGHVFERLEALDADPTVCDRVDVTLKPDPALGVTLVAIRANALGTDSDVALATEAAYVACLVDELTYGECPPEAPIRRATPIHEQEKNG